VLGVVVVSLVDVGKNLDVVRVNHPRIELATPALELLGCVGVTPTGLGESVCFFSAAAGFTLILMRFLTAKSPEGLSSTSLNSSSSVESRARGEEAT
jgi:hypothetical protein